MSNSALPLSYTRLSSRDGIRTRNLSFPKRKLTSLRPAADLTRVPSMWGTASKLSQDLPERYLGLPLAVLTAFAVTVLEIFSPVFRR